MNRIRARRLELARQHPSAFSVVALAHRLGVGESTVRRWEDGSRRPAARQARKLAKELGLTVDEVRAAADEAVESKAEAGRSSHEPMLDAGE